MRVLLLMIIGGVIASGTIYATISCDGFSGAQLEACEICRDSTTPTFNVYSSSDNDEYECGISTEVRRSIFNVLNTPSADGYTNDHNFEEEIELIPSSDDCSECTKLGEGDGPRKTDFYLISGGAVSTEVSFTQYYAKYYEGDEPTHTNEKFQKIYWEIVEGDLTTYQYELRRRHDPFAEGGIGDNEVWEVENIHLNTNTGDRFIMPRQYFETTVAAASLINQERSSTPNFSIISKIIPPSSEDRSDAGIYQVFTYDNITDKSLGTSASGVINYAKRPEAVDYAGYFSRVFSDTTVTQKISSIHCQMMTSLDDDPIVLKINSSSSEDVEPQITVDPSTNIMSVSYLDDISSILSSLSDQLESESIDSNLFENGQISSVKCE